MSQKPEKTEQQQDADQGTTGTPQDESKTGTSKSGEHHVPGADGPSGAEAEEDNNP